MKKLAIFTFLCVICLFSLSAQNVAINSTGAPANSSAMLDISSGSSGLLIPRVTLLSTSDVVTIPSPAISLLVYNTNAAMTGGAVGYWYWNGTQWIQALGPQGPIGLTGAQGIQGIQGVIGPMGPSWTILSDNFNTNGTLAIVTSIPSTITSTNAAWITTGNSNTNDGTNFLGTTDNVPLNFRVGNARAGRIDGTLANTFLGYSSGNNSSAGTFNTVLGYMAMQSMGATVATTRNTAIGANAGFWIGAQSDNTVVGNGIMTLGAPGSYNTALGSEAMYTTNSSNNTAVGYRAMYAPITSTTGQYNTAIGIQSLYGNTAGGESGNYNSALGYQTLYNNSSGSQNTANGSYSLYFNTSGGSNTAIGYQALYKNTTGGFNTAIGSGAITWGPGTGSYNTATGWQSLNAGATGNYNTATGSYSLYLNTGSNNTAYGSNSLYNNSTGSENTASGYDALYSNTTGIYNTAIGYQSLRSNNGSYNTATGYQSLFSNTTGSFNTANGLWALYNNTGDFNTAIGYRALYANTTGSNNTALGDYALSTGAGYIDATAIGYGAQAVGNYTMIFGDASVTGLYTMGGGWFAASDERFKNNVEETVPGLSFITKLRPVTYHYNMDNIAAFLHTPDSLRLKEGEALKSKILYSGFIAQEVEKAANEIGYDFNGISKPKSDEEYYAIDYASFVVPLIKAVQEQQDEIINYKLQITNLETTAVSFQTKYEEQEKINQELQKQLDELKMLIKK